MQGRVEVGNVPEGGGRNFTPYPALGTVRVDCEGETTKSGYINFEPGGIYTINCIPKGGICYESRRDLRGGKSSYPRKNLKVSSTIPIPSDSYKILTHTLRLGEYHPTRRTRRPTQHNRSDVNLHENLSITSVKAWIK